MGLAISTLQPIGIPWHHNLLVLRVLMLIFWWSTFLVILAFIGLTITRYVQNPGLLKKVLDHPDEGLYFACFTMTCIPMENGMRYVHRSYHLTLAHRILQRGSLPLVGHWWPQAQRQILVLHLRMLGHDHFDRIRLRFLHVPQDVSHRFNLLDCR